MYKYIRTLFFICVFLSLLLGIVPPTPIIGFLPALTNWLGTGLVAYAANPAAVQTFFLPLPEDQVRTSFLAIYSGMGATMHTVTGITVTGDGAILYYDQWENGYDADIANPTNLYSAGNPGGTQIWGDGNAANGAPPGIPSDLLNAGTVILLENDIAIPRNPSTILFDGRDKIGATKVAVITKSTWATSPGTVLADAIEVIDTTRWGTDFRLPIGEDLNASSSNMFEYVSLLVMAAEDNTLVQIDSNGDGSVDNSQTLSQGQSYQISSTTVGDLTSNAHIVSSKPVQVDLITGDLGSSYESRWFAIPPTTFWGDSYYTPVGTTSTSYPANVFLYNPDQSSAITINYETKSGAGSVSVPAKGVYRFTMPLLSGAHFYTAGSTPFLAVGTMDSSTTGADQTYDWGYTLMTESFLTTSFAVGWAPGTGNTPPSGNGSPIWVIAVKPTTIYVNYTGDLTSGPNTAPDGSKYNVAYTLSALESKQIYDPDKDQTGMRVYTVDGVTITGAWGEDPSTASAGTPFLDVGYTLLPLPAPVVEKRATLLVDNNSNTLIDPTDTVAYTITVKNLGAVTLFNTIITDTVPSNTTYVANSTELNGAPVADNNSPDTAFPLDEGGLNIGNLAVGGSVIVTFRTIANNFPPVYNTLVNRVTVKAGGEIFTAEATTPINTGNITQCTLDFTDSGGAALSVYTENDTLYITLSDSDQNMDTGSAETLESLLQNDTSGDRETVTLTETGANTGIFTGSIPSSITNGAALEDGTIKASAGDTVQVSYTDSLFGDTCSDTVQVSVPSLTKPLYLSTDGSGSPDQDLDRVDPVATSDTSTANTTDLSSGGATITVVGSAASSSSGQTVSTHSFSYNSGSTGSNRILLVGVAYRNNDSETVSSVNYNGQALTQVGTAQNSSGGTPDGRIYIFYLLNPSTGSHTLQVNWNSNLNQGAVIGAVTYANVDQTTPLGTFASASNTSTSPSVTVASAANELVFGVVGGRSTSNYSVTGGGSSLWSARPFSGQTAGAGQSKSGASPNVALSWSGTNDEWVAGGVSLKPAPATVTVAFTQTPALCSDLALPVSGAVGVSTYVNITSGAMPINPDITAVLKYGATTFFTLTNPVYDSGAGTLTWAGALGSDITLPAAQAVVLEVTSNQSGVAFSIQYDSSTKPSKITLPTTTVINITDFGIYDAPYPGGALINGATNGETVYVRATVSDPFGTDDIRQLDVEITDPASGVTTVPLTSAAATSGCAKIFEYVWATSVLQGEYTVKVIAHEGYEAGGEAITDQASTPFNLNFQDTGTPSISEFTTGNNGTATSSYNPNDTICVRVTDVDQNSNPAAAETIIAVITSSSGDSETVTLTETGVDTGVFTLCLPSSSSTVGTANNGTLYAQAGAGLIISYEDPNDATDTSSATAVVASGTPAINLSKTRLTPADGIAVMGETVRFDLVVSNPGPTTLTTVNVADTFPSSCLGYQSASVTPSSVVTPTINWSIGPIASGANKTISVYFQATAACNPALNSASVAAVDQKSQNVAAGPATAQVITTQPGVSVSKQRLSPPSGTPEAGDSVSFQIAITNTGSTDITTLPLSDNYSAGCLAYTTAAPPADAAGSGTALWNNVGPLAAGLTQTVVVTFTVISGCNPTSNLADVSAAVDENGDSVPAAQASASLTTLSASIGDLVWHDLNGDGLYQGGESGLAGVVVSLTLPSALVITTTTDSNGLYTFANLPSGAYTVTVATSTLPAGYATTTNNSPLSVTLAAGQQVTTADFGFHPAGVVAGVLFIDIDGDGIYSSTVDTPLPAMGVVITDSNGITYSVTTDSNGYYSQTVAIGNALVHVNDADVPTGLMLEYGFVEPKSVSVPLGGVATADFPYVTPLLIDKDTITPAVVAGEQVTYTIVVHNVSAYSLTNVLISDTLPLSFTYAGGTVTAVGASRTSTSNPTLGAIDLIWSKWDISAGGAVTITLAADVLSSATAGSYDNTAYATSDQTGLVDDDGAVAQDSHTPYDQDPEGDEDVTVTTVAALLVTKSDSTDPIVAGTTLTYTIMVTNSGPSDAQDVVITDTLATGTSLLAAPAGCVPLLNQVICQLGTIQRGATVSITIVVTVDPALAEATPMLAEVTDLAQAWASFRIAYPPPNLIPSQQYTAEVIDDDPT
ncbi:MAG: SdrD B-like domain-containing protein [Caldilineaceae bacterium]